MNNESTEKLFYVTQRYGDCGTNLMFHNEGGSGYGTNIDKLRKFTLQEAQKELDHFINSGVLPLLVSEVEKVSILSVDCQYICSLECREYLKTEKGCVIQVTGDWNGNDIYFVSDSGETNDLNKARVYSSLGEAASTIVGYAKRAIWPLEYLETKARRTIQRENINVRKMITGPGIKYKKPRAARPTMGKTRGNCPGCGKITWGYDPHVEHCCQECEL